MKDIYRIVPGFSKVIYSGEVKDNLESFILGRLKNGYIGCWLYNEVLFGRIKDGKISFYNDEIPNFERYAMRIRAFNENEEIHIWKSDGRFLCRYRKDGEGESCEYIDAQQVMLGTKSAKCGDFCEITENIGAKYMVPSEFLNGFSLSPNRRLILKTRNYIGYNEIGQAGFVDSRFVKIYVWGENVG